MDPQIPPANDQPADPRRSFHIALRLGFELEAFFAEIRWESVREAIEEHSDELRRYDSSDPRVIFPRHFRTGGVPDAIDGRVGACHALLTDVRPSLAEGNLADQCQEALRAFRNEFARWWGDAIRSDDNIPRETVLVSGRWDFESSTDSPDIESSSLVTDWEREQEMPHPDQSGFRQRLEESVNAVMNSAPDGARSFYQLGRHLGDARFENDQGRAAEIAPDNYLRANWRDRLREHLSEAKKEYSALRVSDEALDFEDLSVPEIRERCGAIQAEILRNLKAEPESAAPVGGSSASVASKTVPRTDSSLERTGPDAAAVPESVRADHLQLEFLGNGRLNRTGRGRVQVRGEINGRILRLLMQLEAQEFCTRESLERCWESAPIKNTFDNMIRNLRETLGDVDITIELRKREGYRLVDTEPQSSESGRMSTSNDVQAHGDHSADATP